MVKHLTITVHTKILQLYRDITLFDDIMFVEKNVFCHSIVASWTDYWLNQHELRRPDLGGPNPTCFIPIKEKRVQGFSLQP